MFKFVTSPLWRLIESPGHILGTNVDMHTFVQYLDKTATDECISSDFLLKNSSPSSPPVNENDKAMSKLTPSVLWSPLPPKAYYNLLLYFAWLPLTVKNAHSLVSTSPKKNPQKNPVGYFLILFNTLEDQFVYILRNCYYSLRRIFIRHNSEWQISILFCP